MRRVLSPAVWLFCFVLLAFTAHGFPRDSFPSTSASGRHFISPRFLQIFGRQRPPLSQTKEVAAIPLSPAAGPAPVSGKQEPSIKNMLQEVKQEELELKQEVKVLQKEEVDLKAEEREEKLEQERERQEDALENQTQQPQPPQSLSPQVKPPPTPDAVPTPSSSSSEKARPLPAGLVPPVTDPLKSQGVVVVKRAPNQPVQNAMLKTTSMTVDGKPLDLQTPCACVGEPKFCDCYDMRTESAAKKHESVCDKEKDKEKCIYQATDLSKLTVRAHLESPVK